MTQKEPKETTIETQGISLMRRQWAKVDEKAKHTGVISRSAAVRILIDEWSQLTEDCPVADARNSKSR